MAFGLCFANPRYRATATIAIAIILQSRPALAQSAPATDDSTAPDVVVETPPRQAPLAMPTPAPAHRSVWVHIDSPEPVDLGYRASEHDEFAPLCTSPCDTAVPLAGTYRILPVTTGDVWGPQFHTGSLRPSDDFSLHGDTPKRIIAVHPATHAAFAGGVALLIGGGAAFGLGFLWLLAAGLGDSPDPPTTDTAWPVVIAITGGVALVGGLALVIRNHRSGVKVTGNPETPANAPRFFGAASPTRTESPTRANAALAPAVTTFPLFRFAF
jgi:hypothetical protein